MSSNRGLRSTSKAFMDILRRSQHVVQVLFRITADGNDRITADGSPRITANSD